MHIMHKLAINYLGRGGFSTGELHCLSVSGGGGDLDLSSTARPALTITRGLEGFSVVGGAVNTANSIDES